MDSSICPVGLFGRSNEKPMWCIMCNTVLFPVWNSVPYLEPNLIAFYMFLFPT